MIKTLESFGAKENVFLEILHGGHVEYVEKLDQNGDGVFGKMILKYLVE